MPGKEELQYIGPEYHPRDLVDRALIAYFRRKAIIETDGSEKIIPEEGRAVFGFVPHNGFTEPLALLSIIAEKRKKLPIIITKEENRKFQKLSGTRHVLGIDRENPKQSQVKKIYDVLGHEDGSILLALEGTRFGNPEDEDDIFSIGEIQPGLVRFALKTDSDLITSIVIGAHQVVPDIDKLISEKRYKELMMKLMSDLNKNPVFKLSFHKYDWAGDTEDISLKEKVAFHTARIREMVPELILNVDPNYQISRCTL